MSKLFDIVICVGPKDCDMIKDTIEYTKKNVIGYRNIYLICAIPVTIEGAITIDETIFPFSVNDLILKFGPCERHGWYLQQLLKLYAGNVIPNILKDYLIIDADVFFLKPTEFIDSNEKYIYTLSIPEHWQPYFRHMGRLHPELIENLHTHSGVSHHMIVNTDILNSLFNFVENIHDNIPFWKIFIDAIDAIEYHPSGASEYEIYFTYILKFYSDKIIIRELNWCNAHMLCDYNRNCDFVAVHWNWRELLNK
jgi:hypothetical protein